MRTPEGPQLIPINPRPYVHISSLDAQIRSGHIRGPRLPQRA